MAGSRQEVHLEPAKVRRIIKEFFAKSLHIILDARCTCDSPGKCCAGGDRVLIPSVSNRDKWFNLALKECPAVSANLNYWTQRNVDFLAVDMILTHGPPDTVVARSSMSDCFRDSEKIVERWVVRYEPLTSGFLGKDSGGNRKTICGREASCDMLAPFKKIYRCSISVLRSLYAVTRLLPTYNLFRDLKSSRRKRLLKLSHKISSFVEPFTSREDGEMSHFGFTPVDTLYGRLCLSVSFLSKLEHVSLDLSTIPLSTQLVPDYVGSPLAEPTRIFEHLSTDKPRLAFSSIKGLGACNEGHGITPYGSALSSCKSVNSLPPTVTVLQNAAQCQENNLCHDKHIQLSQSPERETELFLRVDPTHPEKLKSEKNFRTGISPQKVFSLGKDGDGKNMPTCSFRALPSSGSGRWFLVDECDISLPFAIVDDDIRIENFNRKELINKSSGRARKLPFPTSEYVPIGALTQMLKSALPLSQDKSQRTNLHKVEGKYLEEKIQPKNNGKSWENNSKSAGKTCVSSASPTPRTVADALLELENYKNGRLIQEKVCYIRRQTYMEKK